LLSGAARSGVFALFKKIITTSYTSDWKCLPCGSHGNRPAFKTRGEGGTSGDRQVVILADQCVPAILPCGGVEACVKILRIEGASIKTLAHEFIAQLGNRRFTPGSVILIFSGSHLAHVGTAAYAADILEVEKLLHEKLSREAVVMPLPPIFLAGLRGESAVRAVYEILVWAKDFLNEEKYLEESFKVASNIITESGVGRQESAAGYRLRLPQRGGGWKIWESRLVLQWR
jgi:hypothetical protein